MKSKSLVIFLGIILLALNAFALTSENVKIVKKDTIHISMAGNLERPCVNSLGNCPFLLTWRQDKIPDEDGEEVTYGRIFDENGKKQGDDILIDASGNYIETTLLNSKKIVAVADGVLNEDAIMPMDISAKIFDFNGYVDSDNVKLVELDRDVNSFHPFVMVGDVEALNNNEFLVTWTKFYDSYYHGEARIVDVNGNPKSNVFSVNSTSSNCGAGNITVLPSKNRFLIVFEKISKNEEDVEHSDIMARFFYNDGESIGNEFLVNSTAKDNQNFPEAVTLSNGNCVIIWRDKSGTESPITGSDIRGQILSPDGSHVGTEFLVNKTTEDDQHAKDVFAIDNFGFGVTWKDDSRSSDTGSAQGSIKGRIFASDGSSIVDEFIVNGSTNKELSQPTGAYLGKDRFVIFWEQGYDIYGQIYEIAGGSGNCYFPHIASNAQWESEIAIINKSKEKLSGRLKAYDSQGGRVSEKNLTLAENARQALTVGNEFSDPEEIGYIVFESDSSNVCGYTKFYKEGHYRVAVPAVQEINTADIYIPHIASNDRWWTGLALVNTTDSPKTLDIQFNTGQTKQINMAPGEHMSDNIKSFFNGVSQPNIKSAVITGGSGVIGLELFSGDQTLSGVLLKDDTTDTLYFPHIASNDKWWTGIAAYNPNSSDANLTVTPYTETGQDLDTLTVSIEAGDKYLGNAKGLSLPEGTAWLKIDSTQPLNGFELFGSTGANNANKWLAGYSAVEINRQEGVFPKLDREGWTGVAFVNTSDSSANVDLSIYDDDGYKVADKSISLAGHEKVVSNPEDIFGGSITAATYMKFSSDSDVVGFQLNGSNDGMMLDGLPGM